MLNSRDHPQSLRLGFNPLLSLHRNFGTIGFVFWINTSRIPEVYLLLLNDPHQIRVPWHLGCISYWVSPVGVRMEILICWLAILNTDFLVYFSAFFYNTFDFPLCRFFPIHSHFFLNNLVTYINGQCYIQVLHNININVFLFFGEEEKWQNLLKTLYRTLLGRV